MATDNVSIYTQRVQAISEIQLLTDFMLDKNDQRLLPVVPPFYVKLITMDQIAFTIRLDSAEIRSKFLQANDEYDFVGIENKTDFLFTDTKGLSIYINASIKLYIFNSCLRIFKRNILQGIWNSSSITW